MAGRRGGLPLNLPPTLFVLGPTAVGKTQFAIDLARQVNGEIINADSRQVYRHMDIGTAKPTAAERAQVPHHLLDLMPPDRNFSLGAFLSLASQAMGEIAGRGRRPLVVGGTGQYLWALQEGWEVPEVAPDEDFRRACQDLADREGLEALHRQLRELDPERAAELDARNLRRVIRALEIHHATGRLPSSYRKKDHRRLPSLVVGLTLERPALYHRIDRRVDRMLADGFLAEVERLAALGYTLGAGPLACPGYRDLGQHLAGQISLAQAVQQTKYGTHRLARRQHAWFRPSDPRIHWLAADSPDLVEQGLALAARPPLGWG